MIPITVYGRLTRDASMSERVQGCCNLSIAAESSTMKEDETGRKRPVPVFFECSVWGKRAETCATYCKKGDSVFVTGDFFPNTYVGRDGQNRVVYNINNASVQFAQKSNRTQETTGGDSGEEVAPPWAKPMPDSSDEDDMFG